MTSKTRKPTFIGNFEVLETLQAGTSKSGRPFRRLKVRLTTPKGFSRVLTAAAVTPSGVDVSNAPVGSTFRAMTRLDGGYAFIVGTPKAERAPIAA